MEALRGIELEKQARRRENLDDVPFGGSYDVVVTDPPWPMKRIDRKVAPGNTGFDYPTMTIDGIIAKGVPAAPDSHLFIWTTQKYLPDAFRCMDAWGFRYVFLMTWHKSRGMKPFDMPTYNSEFVIYCRRGNPAGFVDTKAFSTSFTGRVREHSRKPDEFYETIARVLDGTKVDLFARQGRPGFDVIGNQAAKHGRRGLDRFL